MRDLRDKIKVLPLTAKKKVYIIDEVHMLTTEAFNALLKTLEEPPSHAMFILCTTEPHKVPATILSRCFHIQFKKPTTEELVHAFTRIVAAEKLAIDTQALETIATFADGSFRDGVKILEEIVLGSQGEKITVELIKKVYHTTSLEADSITLLEAFKQKNAQKALTLVQQLVEQGTDFSYFIEQVLFLLHTVLLIQVGISTEKEKITLDLETIKRLVGALSKAHEEIETAVLPQLPLELAIIEWCQSNTPSGSTDEYVQQIQKEVVTQKDESVSEVVSITQKGSLDDKTVFYRLLDEIKKQHHMLAGVLRSCTVKQIDGVLQIEAPSSFHQEKLSDQKALDVLGKVCEDITGNKMKVLVLLKG
jgi:DNA polymerase-3 subunit gamma/tau